MKPEPKTTVCQLSTFCGVPRTSQTVGGGGGLETHCYTIMDCIHPRGVVRQKPYIHFIKGNMHTISPGRNRVNFQILAYLLTIDLLYGTGCLSY